MNLDIEMHTINKTGSSMYKVILFEPNPYHSEVLPGIARYFEDLHYAVDVYIREEIINLNVFVRYDDFKGTIIPYSLKDIPVIFSKENIAKYDFVFFSSMEHSENGKFETFLNELGYIPAARFGILGMYHTNYLVDTFNDYELMQQGRLFCISDFQSTEKFPLSVLTPCFFGKVNTVYKNAGVKKRILIAGRCCDLRYLASAYWWLNKYERNNLEIVQVGMTAPKTNCILKIIRNVCALFNKKYKEIPITYKGILSFPEMYDEIEKCDFILFLADPNKYTSCKHYVEFSTSGSRQLSLGFVRPMILHADLAKCYFSEDSCIAFDTGRLHIALKRILDMHADEYQELSLNLKKYAACLYELSSSNLKNVIANKKGVE